MAEVAAGEMVEEARDGWLWGAWAHHGVGNSYGWKSLSVVYAVRGLGGPMKEPFYQRQWTVMPVFPGTSLGVAIIGRDCAQDLRWCIPSVWGADEIRFADTGSQDGETKDSAITYGASHVYDMGVEGEFDFSAARNTLMEQMKTDWVFVLDTDERLATPMEDLKSLCMGTGVDIWWGYQKNACVKKGEVFWQGTPHVRLFRRGSAGYEGFIHNQLLPARVDCVQREAAYEVEHFGFLNTLAQWERKIEPRLIQHERLADENPDKAMHQYHLLQSYVVLQRWELVKEQAEKVLEVVGRTEHWQNEFYASAAKSALAEAEEELGDRS